MTIGLVGRKRGMTRVFREDGQSVPVTVIEVEPNRITQVKTAETDGYRALQITTGQRRSTRVDAAMSGHFAKADTQPGRGLWEFRLDDDSTVEMNVGDELKLDQFEEDQVVDVSGVTIGKGFQGGVKRHNFKTQDNTHGNSLSHRAPGSIGQCQTPGRVFKGKRMAGHMGNVKRTAQNLKVVSVREDLNVILIQGAVPGAKGGDVIIKPAVKKS